MKATVLCKIAKEIDIKNHIEIISKLVYQPEYLCKKCGRAASSKKLLCDPTPLEAPSAELKELDIAALLEGLNTKDVKQKKEKRKDKKEKHKHEKHKSKDKKKGDKSEKEENKQELE